MTNPTPMPALPPASPAAGAAKKEVPEICRANKTVFTPRHAGHAHPPAKNCWRQQIVIETPGSFDGTRGSCEATIDGDFMQFVFEIPQNDLFTDPHTIHA